MINVLVTGATGHFGKATIDYLLKKGVSSNNIAALVRDETKAGDLKAKGISLKLGTYDDYSSLVAAFQGVDKLLLVSATDLAKRSKQQENVVRAAKEANVRHILYTSFERKNETSSSPISSVSSSHLETEKNIHASGMKYTIFRNNIYADMLPMFFGEKVFETGIFLPAGDASMALATRNDMAEATANVLISEGHDNKEYVFSNTECVTFNDVANVLSALSGKRVSYVSPDNATYLDALSKAGVPSEYAGVFSGFATAMKEGEFEITKTDLEDLLGRKPTSVKAFLEAFYGPKK